MYYIVLQDISQLAFLSLVMTQYFIQSNRGAVGTWTCLLFLRCNYFLVLKSCLGLHMCDTSYFSVSTALLWCLRTLCFSFSPSKPLPRDDLCSLFSVTWLSVQWPEKCGDNAPAMHMKNHPHPSIVCISSKHFLWLNYIPNICYGSMFIFRV